MKMTGKARYKRRWPRVVGWVVLALLFAASIFGIVMFMNRDLNPIPKSLRNELTFSPLVIPLTNRTYTTSDYKFGSAEDSVQLLTYIIHTPEHAEVAVTEYTQPQEFTEIPEYKDRFLSNVANQYATVQSATGTIYLGRMPKQNNKQLAILLERGLILFMTPSRELDDATWRQIGDSLEIQKKTRS